MIPESGRRFGPYQIQARLGGGGMGFVFRAWDARLHREVAIKLLHNEYAMPDMRERFLREARAASALNHPNICTIFDIGEQDGDPYLVMELLEGETLKDRIQRRPIPVEDLVSIARDVAEALGAAHSKGVVHRDVKPANIFLVDKPNGKAQAKVLDFGLAKIEGGPLAARGRHLDLTTAGSTVGTLAYMSPEQARGEVLDLRSDLFSLGVVMYEMATRQTPFQGATSALVFVQLLNHPPEPVREWNDQVPRELEKIILKLMAKERTARYQTAGELEQALHALTDKSDKSGGTGWLRKAIGTVPLVKAPDPVVRDRRPVVRRSAEFEAASDRQAGDPPFPRGAAGSEQRTIRPVRPTQKDASEIRSVRPREDAEKSNPAAGLTGELDTAVSTRVSPPTSRHARERYHPNPDDLFSLSPLQAPEVNSSRGDSSSAVVPKPIGGTGNSGSAREAAPKQNATALESASRIVPVETETHAPEFPWPIEAEMAAAPDLRASASEAGAEGLIDEEYSELRPDTEDYIDPPYRARMQRRSRQWIMGGLLVAVLVTLALLIENRGHLGPTLLSDRDLLAMTAIENKTGDKTLDGTVAEGLQLALEQSPYLRIATNFAFESAMRQAGEDGEVSPGHARAAAERLGAKAYLYGTIQQGSVKDERLLGTQAAYTIHVELMRVADNDVLATMEEHAVSLQQLPGAIDRMAEDIRSEIGENTDSISKANNALSREATGSLQALQAFTLGEDAVADGHSIDALGFYQKAVELDPHFEAAQLRLVVLYRKQRAEVAAAESARAALTAADTTSDRIRVLAQYEYEMNASGDYARATALITEQLAKRPHDSEALADLARVERLQGKLTDALLHAQRAISEDAFNLDAYVQASNSLIGLDRYDAALQVEQQAQRLGLARVGGSLIGGYLEDRKDVLEKAIAEYKTNRPAYRSDWSYGLYLDNSGRLAEGLALWRTNAAAAGKLKGLESAAGFLLAQGALDRALVRDCPGALALAHEAAVQPLGIVGRFNVGMAGALCGDRVDAQKQMDELRRVYPQSTDVNEYMIADLRAALALDANDPASALNELKPVRHNDLISLTPYLRGRAHLAMQQMEIGIVDFQTVLSHRGITFTVGTDVYPVAEIQVARAFASSGDLVNSAAAYRQFLLLWKDADKGQPLLAEARAHSK